MSPQRIQLSRRKGYRKPEAAVVVSRPSKWGNPFRVYRCECCGWWDVRDDNGVTYHVDHKVTREWGRARLTPQRDEQERREAIEHAVRLFHDDAFYWFGGRYSFNDDLDVTQLTGRDLACWCPLDQPCHADVLLEIANDEATR